MKNHLVMLAGCTGEGKIIEPSIQWNFEGAESPYFPVIVTEQQQEDDEKYFKKLNIPWMPEGVSSFQEGKRLDSEKWKYSKKYQAV